MPSTQLCIKKQVTDAPHVSIPDFLGDDVCNSELVRNSKLTVQETDTLDAPLSLDELDNKSMTQI